MRSGPPGRNRSTLIEPDGVRRLFVPFLTLALIAPSATHATDPAAFLRVEGGAVVDGLGRQVLLRGLNHIGLRSDRNHPLDPHAAPAELFELQDLEDQDFATMSSLGFTSVRLVVTWEFAQPDPPPAPYDEGYFALIDDAIARAAAHGMSVVFDFGQFGWSRSLGGNAGAPDWTVSDTCRGMPGPQPGAPPQASASVGCAYYNFWTNGGGIQDAYFDLWRFVAARYADEPAVSMYDLYNEPVGGPLPPGIFESQYLYPFYRRLAAAIREVDPNHIVAFQPPITRSIGVPQIFTERIGIDNAIYLPHSYTLAYTPQRLDPSYTPAHAALLEADLRALVREQGQYLAPLMIGETGWTRSTHADGVGGPREEVDPTAPPAFAAELAMRADQLVLGWHWFAYSSIDEAYGVNHGGALDEPLARALARPFPRATAGRLTHIAWDPEAELYLHGTLPATSFDAPTEVSVPLAWIYRDGACVVRDGVHVADLQPDGTLTDAIAGVSFDPVRGVLRLDPGGESMVGLSPLGHLRCGGVQPAE